MSFLLFCLHSIVEDFVLSISSYLVFIRFFFLSFCSFHFFFMARRRHHKEVTPATSPKSIHGFLFQGLFNLNDLSLECFDSEKAYDHYCSSLTGRRVEVEHLIDLRAFQDTPLPTLVHA